MDGLRNGAGRPDGRGEAGEAGTPGMAGVPGVPGFTGTAGVAGLPQGVAEADAIRLFGAAYRMCGSACDAQQAVAEVLGSSSVAAGADPGAGGSAYGRLVRQVFGELLRREDPVRPRREGHQHAGTWLPEPVLTAGGVLGPLDTAERRESVSMARLVLLERLTPQERAAYVLREVFAYVPADAGAVLGVPEARCGALIRRARQRIRAAEGPGRTSEGEAQRWSTAEELFRAIRDDDRAGVEELLADDVVAWSDGGSEPGVVRRPVLGVAKVGRFLAGARAQIPQHARGQVVEVNGDAAVIATVGAEVIGVLAPEFGPQGLVGIRAVADPGRLVFLRGQWGDSLGRQGAGLL